MGIESAMLTGIGAMAAAGLVVPATRKRFLGSIKNDWLAGELNLDCIDGDGVTVRTKDGRLFRVYKLKGTSYDAKEGHVQLNLLNGRGALFNQLCSAKLTIHLFGIKRKRALKVSAAWPSPGLKEIGRAEAGHFTSSYFIDWFLVISGSSLANLHEGQEALFAAADEYGPRPVQQAGNPDEHCDLTGFLNFLVCGDLRQDLPAISKNLSGRLPGADLKIDRETGTISAMVPHRCYQKILAVREYPEIIDGRLLSDILAINGDIEVCQICEVFEKEQASLLLIRKGREQNMPVIGNQATAEQCHEIVDMLAEGNTTLFHTQLQVIVRAESERELDDLVEAVTRVLGTARVLHSIETAAAPLCWFSRIPRKPVKTVGGTTLLRPLILRDENIAALWAFNHTPRGMEKGPYGPAPVRFLKTPTGGSYAFQFHVSAKKQSIGNFLVFAPTGAGKSTLMLHLLGGLAKFKGVRSYVFDSKEGARFMIETLGGIYQGYDQLQLNPLDVGPDSLEARHRIFMFIKTLVTGLDDEAIEEAINHAVDLAFTDEKTVQTLSAIFPFAFAKRTKLRKALSSWVVDEKGNPGHYAHVFNAKRDSLGGVLEGSHIVGLNMNEALGDPVLGPPVVAHISAAISKAARTKGAGFAIFIDEAAKLLENEGFQSLAAEMYREYRKLDGIVGLSFQDPAALLKSEAARAFIENASTMFFFPNSQASAATLEPFNLNEEQIEFICSGSARRAGDRRGPGREVLIVKRNAATGFDESVIVDVDLSYLGEAMRFYRAGEEANRDLEKAKQTWGEHWLEHV